MNVVVRCQFNLAYGRLFHFAAGTAANGISPGVQGAIVMQRFLNSTGILARQLSEFFCGQADDNFLLRRGDLEQSYLC